MNDNDSKPRGAGPGWGPDSIVDYVETQSLLRRCDPSTLSFIRAYTEALLKHAGDRRAVLRCRPDTESQGNPGTRARS